MNVVKSENCGNSPKNAWIEAFAETLLRGDSVADLVTEDVRIQLANKRTGEGRQALALRALVDEPIVEIVLHDAISHGKKGAIDVEIRTKSGTTIHWGIFLEFKTLKADAIAVLKIVSNP